MDQNRDRKKLGLDRALEIGNQGPTRSRAEKIEEISVQPGPERNILESVRAGSDRDHSFSDCIGTNKTFETSDRTGPIESLKISDQFGPVFVIFFRFY